jgi:uncharacterized protein HemY
MLDGFLYAIGGWDGTVRLDSVEFYNIETNIWTMVPPFISVVVTMYVSLFISVVVTMYVSLSISVVCMYHYL